VAGITASNSLRKKSGFIVRDRGMRAPCGDGMLARGDYRDSGQGLNNRYRRASRLNLALCRPTCNSCTVSARE